MQRIITVVLNAELDELLVAAECCRRQIKAAEGLRSRCRIELVVARVIRKARPDAAQTNGPRVTLNLFQRQAGTVARCDFAQRAWQAEDADALKDVTGKDDQLRPYAPLRLNRRRVAVGAEIALA